MIILIKNKHTLQIDEFKFKCCIGKKGSTNNKIEGDNKTPKGMFKLEHLYFRKDRVNKPKTLLKCKFIYLKSMFIFHQNCHILYLC